jgi:hypothetical protein
MATKTDDSKGAMLGKAKIMKSSIHWEEDEDEEEGTSRPSTAGDSRPATPAILLSKEEDLEGEANELDNVIFEDYESARERDCKMFFLQECVVTGLFFKTRFTFTRIHRLTILFVVLIGEFVLVGGWATE